MHAKGSSQDHLPFRCWGHDTSESIPQFDISQFEPLLKGRPVPPVRPEKGQDVVCKGATTLPSSALMLMAHTVVKREDLLPALPDRSDGRNSCSSP